MYFSKGYLISSPWRNLYNRLRLMIRHLKYLLFFFIYIFPLAASGNIYKDVANQIFRSDSLAIMSETMSYIVYAPLDGIGYAIIEKNEEKNIIGYSKESVWNEEAFPSILVDWLHSHNNSNNRNPYFQNSSKAKRNTVLKNAKESIDPLLSTEWHQQTPYNNYAPVIEDGNVKTVAGCVAIAAAQIAYYWWRDNPYATLKDTPIYPYGGAPITYSIPKGTPNEWELIKDKYDEANTEESEDAVARLCYVIGTTSYLDYASSTGGQIRDAANAIYSQYNLVSEYLSRKNCSQEYWEQLLYNELYCRRPILCSGTGSGGHAFVLDGYDNNTGLFHFNFGWGGSGDGYYPIDDSDMSMGGYYMNQSVVYNIHPVRRSIDANISILGIEDNHCKICISIKNMGTLPARIKLVHDENDNIQNSHTECLWESLVNNDSISLVSEVMIDVSDTKSNATLLLIDEYDSVLCKYKFDMSGIPSIYNVENSNLHIIGIDGKQHKAIKGKGIYVIHNNKSTKKILVR